MRHTLASFFIGLTAIACQQAAAAPDADVSLVVNPRIGTAEIRNDSDSFINLNGYIIRSPDGVLNQAGWNSFADNSSSFVEGGGGSPEEVLSEVSLFSSELFSPQGSFVSPIGAPYTPFVPSSFGEPEPRLEFTYSTTGGEVKTGDVEFSVVNNIALVIDTTTGASFLQNQSVFDVEIDSYLILSGAGTLEDPAAVLNPAGWSPLENDGDVPGWVATSGSDTRLGEGNLLGATLLAANGGMLEIGSPIDPTKIEDETDLSLEFSVAGVGTPIGQSFEGVVQFIASQTVQGDFSGDGIVDNSDLNLLLSNWGSDSVPPEWVGDVTLPVDNDELNNLLVNWGFGVPESTAIPEPTALVMAAAGLGMMLNARRRSA